MTGAFSKTSAVNLASMLRFAAFRLVACLAVALTVCLLAGASVASSVTDAYAADLASAKLSGVFELKCVSSGKLVDISGGSYANGANAQQWDSNCSPAQRFRVESAGDGYFYLTCVNSDLVLDVEAGAAVSGTNVQQWEKNGSKAQKWKFIKASDGSYYVVSALSSSIKEGLAGALVLAVKNASTGNGANLQLSTFAGTKSQRFGFAQICAVVSSGLYRIFNASSSNYCVSLKSASTSTGTNIQMAASDASKQSQKFKVAYDSSTGYYTITNIYSGKRLAIADGVGASGANVAQVKASSWDRAQLWSITRASDGTLRVRSALSGMSLALGVSTAKSGSNVKVLAFENAKSQRWTFTATYPLANGKTVTIASALGGRVTVDGFGTAAGTNVQLGAQSKAMDQRFRVVRVTGGYYKLESMLSGKVLAASGTNVELAKYSGVAAQLWKAVPLGGGGYVAFKNKATGTYLQVSGGAYADGTNLTVASYTGRYGQLWRCATTNAIPTGLYTVSSAASKNQVLDIDGASVYEGANLQLYQSNDTAAQKFWIRYLGSGRYSISCMASGMAMSAPAGLTASGTSDVYQAEFADELNQKWTISYVGGGKFVFYTALSSKASCLSAAGTGNCSAVDIAKYTGASTQQFTITPADSITMVPLSMTLNEMLDWQMSYYGDTDYTKEEVRDCLDPSTYSGTDLYAFADLRGYTGLTAEQLNAYIDSSYLGPTGSLSGQGAAFVAAAKKYDINEVYLVSHAVLESGWGTSALGAGFKYDGKTKIDGKTYKAGTYYNFFGIGAYDSDPINGGQSLAIKKGWNSVEKAIMGGAEFIATNYFYAESYPQYTLYDMKWDTLHTQDLRSRGWKQYATGIEWIKTNAKILSDIYVAAGVSPRLSYLVPSYQK